MNTYLVTTVSGNVSIEAHDFFCDDQESLIFLINNTDEEKDVEYTAIFARTIWMYVKKQGNMVQ
jgi:hypothetical protein